jgi:polyisoprenyl-phosphate glycosyltransferase
MTSPGRYTVAVLIPVYNDWAAAGALLRRLGDVLAEQAASTHVILLDDASTDPSPLSAEHVAGSKLSIAVLALRRNLGHQRAIAVGLAWVERHLGCDAVVVMDGDGEDDPDDVPRLLQRLHDNGHSRIVFAERTRRLERPVFRFFYRLYCAAHRLLTGMSVRVGNFSAIPAKLLSRLVTVAELWNHYAAAVFQARIAYEMIPTVRARRLAGHSRMNFVALVAHGLSAISVHSQIVGVRLLIASGVLAGLAIGTLLLAFTYVAITNAELSLRTWVALLALVFVLLQIAMAAVTFVFTTLYSRAGASFLPIRDYQFYVGEVTLLCGAPDSLHERSILVSR